MPRKEKPRRKGNAKLQSQVRDGWPPAPRYAVLLPLVDGFNPAVVSAGPDAPQRLRYGETASDLLPDLVEEASVGVLLLHPALVRNIFGTVKRGSAEFSSDDIPQALRHALGMAWKGETPQFRKECGARLRRAREATGYDSLRAFANDTGTDEDNLGNWERGVAQVPPSYISQLKRTIGIDHAWVYDEDASGLPGELRKKLLTKDRRKLA